MTTLLLSRTGGHEEALQPPSYEYIYEAAAAVPDSCVSFLLSGRLWQRLTGEFELLHTGHEVN